MEIKEWKYGEFPEFDEVVEGVVVLDTTGDEPGCRYTGQHVEYVKEGGVPLHMEILTPFTRNKQEGVYPIGANLNKKCTKIGILDRK